MRGRTWLCGSRRAGGTDRSFYRRQTCLSIATVRERDGAGAVSGRSPPGPARAAARHRLRTVFAARHSRRGGRRGHRARRRRQGDHFASKDDLVLAFLERRHQHWTDDIQQAQTRHTDGGPEQRLLAIFDVLDERLHSKEFDAYLFFNALVEMGADHPAGRASVRHVEHIRSIVRQLADEAGLRDTDDFARSWHILMKGSVIAAAEGDPDAAEHAKAMASSLIERHRQPAS